MVLTSGDSTSVMLMSCPPAPLYRAASRPAVSQPALPPPTITIRFIGVSVDSVMQKKAAAGAAALM